MYSILLLIKLIFRAPKFGSPTLALEVFFRWPPPPSHATIKTDQSPHQTKKASPIFSQSVNWPQLLLPRLWRTNKSWLDSSRVTYATARHSATSLPGWRRRWQRAPWRSWVPPKSCWNVGLRWGDLSVPVLIPSALLVSGTNFGEVRFHHPRPNYVQFKFGWRNWTRTIQIWNFIYIGYFWLKIDQFLIDFKYSLINIKNINYYRGTPKSERSKWKLLRKNRNFFASKKFWFQTQINIRIPNAIKPN